jgi:hypothetical protein
MEIATLQYNKTAVIARRKPKQSPKANFYVIPD